MRPVFHRIERGDAPGEILLDMVPDTVWCLSSPFA